MDDRAEIQVSELGENSAPRRRGLILAISACVFAAVVFCAGGIALVAMNNAPAQIDSSSSLTLAPLPWIVVGEGQAVKNADLNTQLNEETKHLSEAVEAGEKVYVAAHPSAAAADLKRLRSALDAASDALDAELDEGAGKQEREKRLEHLKKLRTRVLDAAAQITEVRTVPDAELPPGTGAVAADDGAMPGGDGSEPRDEAAPSGDIGEDTSGGKGGTGGGDDNTGDDNTGDDGTGGGSGGDDGEGSEPDPTQSSDSPTPTPSSTPSQTPTTPPPSGTYNLG